MHQQLHSARRAVQTYALDGASVCRASGRFYSALGMDAPRGGVFHSKLYLRIGRRAGELLVGSANMTAPGLAGNRELMGMVGMRPGRLWRAEDHCLCLVVP